MDAADGHLIAAAEAVTPDTASTLSYENAVNDGKSPHRSLSIDTHSDDELVHVDIGYVPLRIHDVKQQQINDDSRASATEPHMVHVSIHSISEWKRIEQRYERQRHAHECMRQLRQIEKSVNYWFNHVLHRVDERQYKSLIDRVTSYVAHVRQEHRPYRKVDLTHIRRAYSNGIYAHWRAGHTEQAEMQLRTAMV